MTHFKILEHTVDLTIDGEDFTYDIKPLPGKYYPDLLYLSSQFGSIRDEDGELDFSELDREMWSTARTLVLETFKKSYPDTSEDVIEDFVTQNFMSLLEPVLLASLPEQEEE